jgi:hypothetical protein
MAPTTLTMLEPVMGSLGIFIRISIVYLRDAGP